MIICKEKKATVPALIIKVQRVGIGIGGGSIYKYPKSKKITFIGNNYRRNV